MASVPRDAQVMQAMLRELGVSEYEPRVVSQMLDFAYRYTTDLLDDARSISEHAGKKQIDESDVQFAVDNAMLSWRSVRPDRQLLLELAEQKNALPLPPIRQNYGLRLPNDRFCLVQPNMQWKGEERLREAAGEHGIRNEKDTIERIDAVKQTKPEAVVNVLKRKATDDDDFDNPS